MRTAQAMSVGALVGGAWCGVEALTVWAVGLTPAHGPWAVGVLLATVGGCAALWAVVGAVARAPSAAAVSLTSLTVLTAWSLVGKLVDIATAGGLDASVVAFGTATAALLAAWIVDRWAAAGPARAQQLTVVASALGLTLAIGLPVQLHVYLSPWTAEALGALAGTTGVALLLGWAIARGTGPKGWIALGGGLTALAYLSAAWPHPTPVAPEVAATGPGAGRRPALLVVVDTLRKDRLGVYGNDRGLTPHLDRLAAGGVAVPDAIAPAPWTLPSVASLLTGRPPWEHGAGVNPGPGNTRTGLRAGLGTTWLGELRAEGWTTAAIVTNPWLTRSTGLARDLDHYDDRLGPGVQPVLSHPADRLFGVGWPRFRRAEAITDAALELLARWPDEGWVLVVHYMDAHGPFDASDEELRAIGVEPATAKAEDRYDAAVARIDAALGRLLRAMPHEAVVAVVADHGEEWGEARKRPPGTPVGARHGHTLHAELLEVPMILRGVPGSDRLLAGPVSLVELGPIVHEALDPGGSEALPAPAPVAFVRPDAVVRPDADVLSDAVERSGAVVRSGAVLFGPRQTAATGADVKVIVDADGTRWFDRRADRSEQTSSASPPAGWSNERAERFAEPPSVGVTAGSPSLDLSPALEALGYSEP